MLNNYARIIQKIASTKTLGLCLCILKNCSPHPQLQRPLAPYQVPIVKNVIYRQDAYGNYLSFATLESYVACVGAKVFMFP